MLHRAMFGSLERFIGILIEHHAGKFPFWLAPDQIAVLPISSEQNDYAIKLKMLLEKKGLRTIIDIRNEKINYKIREHSEDGCPIILIVGDKEGVVVVPNEIIKEISDEVKSMTIYEDYVIDKVQKGATIRGLYPLTDENEKKIFENWLRTKKSD